MSEIKLEDDHLDASHGPTKMLLAAEYWKREAEYLRRRIKQLEMKMPYSSDIRRKTTSPMDRAALAAHGKCVDNLDGTLTVSTDWLYDYSRLLLQQACEARLRNLGTVVGEGSTREAVEDFLRRV